MKIYLLISSSGMWDDYTEIIEGAYIHKDNAEKAKKKYNIQLSQKTNIDIYGDHAAMIEEVEVKDE